jgi:hypothetical protein
VLERQLQEEGDHRRGQVVARGVALQVAFERQTLKPVFFT